MTLSRIVKYTHTHTQKYIHRHTHIKNLFFLGIVINIFTYLYGKILLHTWAKSQSLIFSKIKPWILHFNSIIYHKRNDQLIEWSKKTTIVYKSA